MIKDSEKIQKEITRLNWKITSSVIGVLGDVFCLVAIVIVIYQVVVGDFTINCQ